MERLAALAWTRAIIPQQFACHLFAGRDRYSDYTARQVTGTPAASDSCPHPGEVVTPAFRVYSKSAKRKRRSGGPAWPPWLGGDTGRAATQGHHYEHGL